MVATFDVPGTVTLRDVSRPASGETIADRLHRLAQKGLIEGCAVMRAFGSGRFIVTSSRDPRTVYEVDHTAQSCTCPGYSRFQACKHIALVLAELGELPDPEPEPPAPAVAAPGNAPESGEDAAADVLIACEACAGGRFDAVQNRAGDWIDVPCPVCDGRGEHRITVALAELATYDRMTADRLRGTQCDACSGHGYVRMKTGGYLSDWEPVECRACQGAGMVPVPVSEPSAPAVAA